MSLRSLFKSHFRTRRISLITEFIYLRNNITLMNSIRSTFIESISLFSQNNTVTYKPYSRIVWMDEILNWRMESNYSVDIKCRIKVHKVISSLSSFLMSVMNLSYSKDRNSISAILRILLWFGLILCYEEDLPLILRITLETIWEIALWIILLVLSLREW